MENYNNVIDKLYRSEWNKEIFAEEFNTFVSSKTATQQILIILDNAEDALSRSEIEKKLSIPDLTTENLRRKLYTHVKNVTIGTETKGGKNYYSLFKNGRTKLKQMYADFFSSNEYLLQHKKEYEFSGLIDSKKQIKQLFQFIEDYYNKDLIKAIGAEQKYLIVQFPDLIEFDYRLADLFIDNPVEMIAILEETLKQFFESDDEIYSIKARLEHLPQSQTIDINTRRLKHLNKLIQIKGVIKRKTKPQPQIKYIEYLCTNPACHFSEDKIRIPQFTTNMTQLKVCPKCKTSIEIVNKVQIDNQYLILEEDISTTSRINVNIDSIRCQLQEDLTDTIKDHINDIGAKVMIVGILKEMPIKSKGGEKDTINSEYFIDVNNVVNNAELNDMIFTPEDIKEIKEFGAREDCFTTLKDNFIPQIFGYPTIKEALLLQLFGGVELLNPNNPEQITARAESHILLLGDPGVAKSQLLKHQQSYTKKSMYSSGSGSTKAGLVGAVIKDEFSKEWVLEAGAMAKAHCGNMGIDEMDKMREEDTGVLHEAMEHGQTTINKANINATINCKAAVTACANPKFSRFMPDMTIAKQIEFPTSLLSRFDLIFIMRDIPDYKKDLMLAQHISSAYLGDQKESKLTIDFFRKYINYCKENLRPVMQKETALFVDTKYAEKRQSMLQKYGEVPLGSRQHQGWYRLAYAIAKANFSKTVEVEHAQRAIEIFDYCWDSLGQENNSQIENIESKYNKKDGTLYNEILKICKNNENVTIEELENMFSKDKPQLKQVIDLLIKEGKIYSPRKGTIKLY